MLGGTLGGCLTPSPPGTPSTQPAGETEGPTEPTVIVKTVKIVQDILPDLLIIAGAAGVPMIGAIGVALQKARSAAAARAKEAETERALEDVVRSVQDAKADLGVKTKSDIRKALSTQQPETMARVKAIKAKLR